MLHIKNTYRVAQSVLDFTSEVYNAFIAPASLQITFAHEHKSMNGVFHQYPKQIVIYANNKSHGDINHLKATIAHEIGHAYYICVLGQKHTDSYQSELLADNFSSMCLGKDWKEYYRSYYPAYASYSRSQNVPTDLELTEEIIDNVFKILVGHYKGYRFELTASTSKGKYYAKVKSQTMVGYYSIKGKFTQKTCIRKACELIEYYSLTGERVL